LKNLENSNFIKKIKKSFKIQFFLVKKMISQILILNEKVKKSAYVRGEQLEGLLSNV